jgi:hypothetical protein
VIYTESVLEVVHSFVLNTVAMTEEELEATGLEPLDVTRGSPVDFDHLPVVVDVRPVGGRQRVQRLGCKRSGGWNRAIAATGATSRCRRISARFCRRTSLSRSLQGGCIRPRSSAGETLLQTSKTGRRDNLALP